MTRPAGAQPPARSVVVLLMLLSAVLAGAAVAVGAMVVGRQAKAVSSRPDSVAVSPEASTTRAR
ncbi:hypothetical protein [Tessaracoccus sp. Y1736]